MNEKQQLIDIALYLADMAGEIAQSRFRNQPDICLKSNKSPVTEADLMIEKILRTAIQENFPSHGILGEEYGLIEGDGEYVWVLDPIDGTTSFACGKPTFCILIALLHNNIPILGIIDQPISKDRWIGVYDQSTTWNDQICQIRPQQRSDFIRLSCTTPDMFVGKEERDAFAKVCTIASVVSYGGDAYAYGLLAAGHIDIILEADLQYYDVAALIPIIEGAGGFITDWQGNVLEKNHFKGKVLAAGSSELHKKVLDILANS